jgi:probable F420-dependent oxidoreductase
VLVLPQRNPVLLAKQVASITMIAGGRVALGVGSGWLREEFAALDAPFETRGARMDEWLGLLRECWTGRPAEHRGAHYHLPPDTLVLPPPAAPVPLYVGGHSSVALRRAGRLGDGWLAQQSVPELNPHALAGEVATVRAAATGAGRAAPFVVLRLVESAGRLDDVARRLGELADAGVDEIIVDATPAGDPARDHGVLRAATP